MYYQMKTLLNQVQALHIANTRNHGHKYGRGRGRGRGRSAGRGFGSGRLSDPPTLKYFWTHENCRHGSEQCTYPAVGHRKYAYFAHMMGGSTKRSYTFTEWEAGAVDLRHINSKILSLEKHTISHSPVMPKTLPDTAATAHYLHPDALPHCYHITRITSGSTFQVANINIIKPDLRSTFKMSNKLLSKAQSAHVFNNINTSPLISMGQLFDDDCIAIFTKFDVKILKHNQVITTGLRDRTNVLYNITLEPSPPLNNHQNAPIQTKPTEFSAMIPPNTNSPNTSTQQPSASSSLPSYPPSTKATSRHGLAFLQALSPNIFQKHPSQWKSTSTKSKIIFFPLNHINISLKMSNPKKNNAPTTSSLPSSISTPRLPNHTPTKQDYFRSSLHVVTNTYSSYLSTTPTPSTPNFSRTNRPWRSLQPGWHTMNTYNNPVHPPLSTS